jgi:hypothetical protein
LPEELLAAGEVADGEQACSNAVDDVRRFGEVHRPDRIGRGPIENVQRLPMSVAPYPAVADEQVAEFGASHRGEGRPQRRQTEAGAVLVKVLDHRVAVLRCGPMGWAADEPNRVSNRGAGVPPLPEGAGGDMQQVGNVGPGVTDGGDVRSHGDRVPANEFLAASILQPACEPAGPSRRPCWLGNAQLFDDRHLGLLRWLYWRGYGVFFSAAAAV